MRGPDTHTLQGSCSGERDVRAGKVTVDQDREDDSSFSDRVGSRLV